VVKIYSNVNETRLRRNDLMQCITGAQARSDGYLLVSSHSEDYVLEGRSFGPWKENADLWFTADTPQADVDANIRKYQENANATLRAYPEVFWWRLDPATGQIQRERPPENVPDRVDSVGKLLNFNWCFRPDGSLKFRDLKTMQKETTLPNPGELKPQK
jgi:hypothetical protein